MKKICKSCKHVGWSEFHQWHYCTLAPTRKDDPEFTVAAVCVHDIDHRTDRYKPNSRFIVHETPHWPDRCGHGRENYLFTVKDERLNKRGDTVTDFYDVHRMERPGGETAYCMRYGNGGPDYLSSLTIKEMETSYGWHPTGSYLYTVIVQELKKRGQK